MDGLDSDDTNSSVDGPPPEYDFAVVLPELEASHCKETVIHVDQLYDQFRNMEWSPQGTQQGSVSYVPTYNYVPSSVQLYKKTAVHITCLHCGYVGKTKVTKRLKKKETFRLCLSSLIFCMWICCICLYPFCTDAFRVFEHCCPKCKTVLSKYDPAEQDE